MFYDYFLFKVQGNISKALKTLALLPSFGSKIGLLMQNSPKISKFKPLLTKISSKLTFSADPN